MTHPCNECANFTDGKCCHETKICLSNSAKNETQTDLSIESDSQFKVGDKVVVASEEFTVKLLKITQISHRPFFIEPVAHVVNLDGNHDMYGIVLLRHATPAEIKAGHRINFNLNDVVATALDDLGDDKNIENHVSPQCVVGGDQ